MKFIATILATAAAVNLEGDYVEDGVFVAVTDGLTAVDALDLAYTVPGANNLNVFNFYGIVAGNVQGIADSDGLEGLARGANGLDLLDLGVDRAILGADGTILDGALSTTVLPGLGGIAVDADGLAAT